MEKQQYVLMTTATTKIKRIKNEIENRYLRDDWERVRHLQKIKEIWQKENEKVHPLNKKSFGTKK